MIALVSAIRRSRTFPIGFSPLGRHKPATEGLGRPLLTRVVNRWSRHREPERREGAAMQSRRSTLYL
jgi:hypothetical protein